MITLATVQEATTLAQSSGHKSISCNPYGDLLVAPSPRRDVSTISAYALKLTGVTAPSFRVQGGAEQTSNNYLQIYIPGPKRIVALSGYCQIAGAPLIYFKDATGLGAADSDFVFSPATGTVPFALRARNNATTNWWSDFVYEQTMPSIPCPNGILLWGSPYIPPTTVDPLLTHRPIKNTDSAVVAFITLNVFYTAL